jgi:lipopolysaccharide transport system permease protein
MEPATAPPVEELVLRPVSRWSLRELRDLWAYRELFWILALRDVSIRYKQTFLGVAWALLQPGTQMLIFTVLFHRLAGIRPDSDVPYPIFCLSGVVVWQLFSNGLSQASESLTRSANLITKVFFPRLIIPVASIMATIVDFGIGFAFLLILMIGYGLHPRASMLLALPLALLAALSAMCIGLWTSALNLMYRDVRHALPFVLQLLVYLTPVFYPSSLIPEQYRWLTGLNPMAAVVESFRASLFGTPLPLARLGVSAIVMLVFGLTGYPFFRSMERTFADRV